MKLGENIYQNRTARGLSQGGLADALEVSRQSVSKWENGSAVPELDKLLKLSKLFDITLDELVHGPAEKPEEAPAPVPSVFPKISARIFVGSSLLLFGMVFFLLSVFWGDQLRFGEEFGELVSLSIVLFSISLIATYNQWILAICAVIYVIYNILCVGVLHVDSRTNDIFLFFTGIMILVWFIVLGLHVNKKEPVSRNEEPL